VCGAGQAVEKPFHGKILKQFVEGSVVIPGKIKKTLVD
jgi:hypothetical protein